MDAGLRAPGAAHPSQPTVRPRERAHLAGAVAVGGVVGAAAVLRFATTSDLWLDEALTVHIARLPVGDLLDALRHDGAPPLSYLLLHGWIRVFGEGDTAVRSLSGVLALATLPAIAVVARRRLGRTGVWPAVLLLASSPFAIRYATEARMYALASLLTLAGWLALARALERPTRPRLIVVSVAGGLLLLTHYWAIYLLGVTLAGLLGRAAGWPARGGDGPEGRRAAWRVALAVAGSVVVFAPWLPSFWSQLRHTGTPWARPAGLDAFTTTVGDLGGAARPEARLLALVLVGLVLLALLARPLDRWRFELDLRTRPGVRAEVAVAVATVVLAVVAGRLLDSAFATRYVSLVLPLVLLAAAAGVTAFADRRVRVAVLAVAVACGLAGGVRHATTERTQAAQVADLISRGGTPRDLVVYCPDQLGPAVHRLLPTTFDEVTFPRLSSPARVDWVDYEDRHRQADPEAFVRRALARAGDRAVWLVWAPGYRSLGGHCETVRDLLLAARPDGTSMLTPDHSFFEHHALVRYPGP